MIPGRKDAPVNGSNYIKAVLLCLAVVGFGGWLYAQSSSSSDTPAVSSVGEPLDDQSVNAIFKLMDSGATDPNSDEFKQIITMLNSQAGTGESTVSTDEQASPTPPAAASVLPERPATSPESAGDAPVPTEEEIAALFEAWSDAEMEDPDSPRTAELERLLDDAMARREAADVDSTPTSPQPDEILDHIIKKRQDQQAQKNVPPSPASADQSKIDQPVSSQDSQLSQTPDEDVQWRGPETVEPAPSTSLSAELEVPSPDQVVRVKTEDGLIDLGLLLEVIGRELKYSFLYDTTEPVAGKFRLEQYGELHRRDLIPLLESLLGFKGMAMVRAEDSPFIRIVQKSQSLLSAEPPFIMGEESPEDMPAGNMVVTHLLKFDYVTSAEVKALLANFTDVSTFVDVPNTNYVIFTEYASKMPRLLELIRLMDQPGPKRRLEPMTLTYVQAQDVVGQLNDLISDLGKDAFGDGQDGANAPAAKRTGPIRHVRGENNPEQNAQAVPGSSSNVTGPALRVDERTNRLFVIGTEEEIALVARLLALLDIEGQYDKIRLASIQVEHVLATEVRDSLSELVEVMTARGVGSGDDPADPGQANQNQPNRRIPVSRLRQQQQSQTQGTRAGEDGPFLLAYERTNHIFVVGTDEHIALVKELLSMLDVVPYEYAQPMIKVYQPQFVEAQEALDILDQLRITESDETLRPRERADLQNSRRMPTPIAMRQAAMEGTMDVGGLPNQEEFDVAVAVQPSTNKMFVLATGSQHQSIAELMAQIDVEPNDLAGDIQIYFLENREPSVVADMLENLMDSERSDADENTTIPGVSGAPNIVALEDIYAVAVRASKKQHKEIQNIIEQLDRRMAQVLVEAILVQVSVSDALKLGVSLGETFDADGDARSSRQISTISPFSIGEISRTGNIVSGTGATLAFLDSDRVYATLEALQTQGNSKVVSKPRILVNDHETGSITSDRSKPTTKTTIQAGSDTPIVTFDKYVEAGTQLEITPHISEGDFVKLEISLTVDSFEGEGTVDIPPPKSNNNISTIVNVPDDMTIVLGGLTTRSESIDENKVPILGDIPLIGALFRNVSRSDSQAVLYVFVRSRIIRSRDENANFEDLDRISAPYRERLELSERQYYGTEVIPGIKPEEKDNFESSLNEWGEDPTVEQVPAEEQAPLSEGGDENADDATGE